MGKREIVEGISEAIKMGCIHKPKLFELLEAHGDSNAPPAPMEDAGEKVKVEAEEVEKVVPIGGEDA